MQFVVSSVSRTSKVDVGLTLNIYSQGAESLPLFVTWNSNRCVVTIFHNRMTILYIIE